MGSYSFEDVSPYNHPQTAGFLKCPNTAMTGLSEADQFMIMLNVCAVGCGSVLYCLCTFWQKQSECHRQLYYPEPFVSLAEASQTWHVYRQCSRTERDGHVCNFCGFQIKAMHAEVQRQLSVPEDARPNDGKSIKPQRQLKKKGKDK